MLYVRQMRPDQRHTVCTRPFPKLHLVRWRWLEPYIERALRWLGASERYTHAETVVVPAEIDLTKGPRGLLPAVEAGHRRNDPPAAILLGREHYALLQLSEMQDFAIASSARYGFHGETCGRRLFGVPIVVVPTMEGAVVLPQSVLDAIRTAPRENGW